MVMLQFGESVIEGMISKWLVFFGDYVNKYDFIVEVMIDKVNVEVLFFFMGMIIEFVGEEGQIFVVGEIICKIEIEKMEI